MSRRKPLDVLRTVPPAFPLRRNALFPIADRLAATILVETVTNEAPSAELTDDALIALMRRSRHYTHDCEAIDHEQAGDVMNACFDAGLMLGLAFGLRLRGAA